MQGSGRGRGRSQRLLQSSRSKASRCPLRCTRGFAVHRRTRTPFGLHDPDDEIYLATALAGRAEVLITGNIRHFPRPRYGSIAILRAGAFLSATVSEADGCYQAASYESVLPRRPISRDQVTLMQKDNVVSPGALTFADLGITPAALEAIAPIYLRRHPAG
jgi:hypothetical protein